MVKKNQPRFRRLKAFGTAFCLTLCLLGMGVGFLVADYNTRKVTFGAAEARQTLPAPEPGRTPLTEEQEAWAGRLWTIIPARWRAAAWLTEMERDLAPGFLDMINRELERTKRLYSTTGRLYDKVPVSGDFGAVYI